MHQGSWAVIGWGWSGRNKLFGKQGTLDPLSFFCTIAPALLVAPRLFPYANAPPSFLPFPLSPALPLTPYAPAMRRVGDGCLARFSVLGSGQLCAPSPCFPPWSRIISELLSRIGEWKQSWLTGIKV